MDMLNDPALTAFRDEVSTFLAAHLPDDIRRGAARATSVFIDPDISLPWQRILHAKGWAAPDWPAEFGGPGWSEIERYIFAAECAQAGAPNLAPMGLKMVAPVIMHYGSAEQRAHYLPRILSGEDYWCQGFSEPGAGSDLAALQLRAVPDGSDYILNGSKIWTTHAHFANRMFALVRTSNEGKPQAGISFLLLDMATPGIIVEPIRTLAGDHEFNQVFFDDVRVPQANRLGEENEGWSVAKHLLTFERGGKYAPGLIGRLERLRARDDIEPVLRAQLDREAVTLKALQALEMKAMRGVGGSAALYASALKILGTETAQRIDTLACEIAGHAAWADADGQTPAELAVAVPRYLNDRAATIYAGSNEIQRDLIARTMLG
ncbi:acyl-CoA dehydrogenase [Sphingopyxis sp. H038]|uniref:acyl-CoA dehydrogenase family protein n=2 Tax=unclassified Sphingopyxis TaxID=2614943 RepID=UPI000731356E|nr:MULTISPECIES: acyl-CoA dehydrogenase family protein [unclassified Sphingopyxis]KTE09019.1 acyl-CoA dehydrogenase [Sphingopyxis sp. H093]KTE25297.1 acyl-CoA dehydrogenase [Sphingopyxis sp. H080]KTE40497.1 acyl-CoA dehydrogenase [Sphingopyxis sp. H077]KTE40607.1 acyl-CoA dehydrogenase [Sphingopyxis sp. H005]KTD99969.1 acyl-CoA dehydrogenase [Sphingopyxis sp. H012]